MKKICLSFLLLASLTSCNNFLDCELESNIPYEGNYTDKTMAELAVIGLYGSLATAENWGIYNLNVMIADIGTHTSSTYATDNKHVAFKNYSLTPDHYVVTQLYESSYKSIEQANQVISNLERMVPSEHQMSTTLHQCYMAEARFIRALNYFNLVRYYGGVTVKLTPTVDMENLFPERDNVQEVYAAIIADLNYAKEFLYYKPTSALAPQYDGKFVGRATRTAATALLSKVYLTAASYKKHSKVDQSIEGYIPDKTLNSYDWVNVSEYYTLASNYAEEIITLSNTGAIDVRLNDDYGYLFTPNGENSAESIFEVQFKTEPNLGSRIGAWTGMLGYTRFNRRLIVNPDYIYMHDIGFTENEDDGLVLDYTKTDPRLMWNVSFEGMVNKPAPLPLSKHSDLMCFKFRLGTPILDDETGVNFVVLRYADVLLMYAEAQNELGNMGVALDAVNQIRTRARNGSKASASMPMPYTALIPASTKPSDYAIDGLTQEDIREIIINERYMELAFEGHSRFDEIRMGRLIDIARASRVYADELAAGSSFLPAVWNSGGPSTVRTNEPTMASYNARYTYQFFPIPKRQIDRNTNLKQNPGW